jgi:ABC-type sugar transport system permease subunit
MSKDKISKHFENLSNDAKVYLESEIAYYKLDAYKKLIKATSFILRFIVVTGVFIVLLSFLSLAVGLWLGELLNHYYLGFLIIAGVYLVLFIFLLIFGKPFITSRVLKIFNHIFKDI